MPIQITLPLLLMSSLLLTATASPPPPHPPSCTDELVSFSPCLAYVSLPPNKITDNVSTECCDVVLSIFAHVEANCFCYLIKQPNIFGFPFNQTRVVSLPSTCVSMNSSSSHSNITSLYSVCSGSRALPPLRSARGSGISDPGSLIHPYNGPDNVQSPPESVQPESDNSPPMLPLEPNVSAAPMGSNFPASPPPVLFTTSVEESSSANDISEIKHFLLQVIVATVVFMLV